MYASSWFLTLFASVFPLNASFRIMDVFICEVRGDKRLKNFQLSNISLLERVLIQASQFTHFQAYQEQSQCNCI